jgi:asparagine synthetase B (glutamine-hydrolysing)
LQGRRKSAILFSGGLDSATVSIAAENQPSKKSKIFAALGSYTGAGYQTVKDDAISLAKHLGISVEVQATAQFGPLSGTAAFQTRSPEPFLPINAGVMVSLFDKLRPHGCEAALTGFGADQLFAINLTDFFLDLIADGKAVFLPLRAFQAHRCGWVGVERLALRALRTALRPRSRLLGLLNPHSVKQGSVRCGNESVGAANGEREVFPWCKPGLSIGYTAQFMGKVLTHGTHLRWMRWWRMLADLHDIPISHPFLDLRVIRFLVNTPYDIRVGVDLPKRLLRRSFDSRLPHIFAHQKRLEWPIVNTWLVSGVVQQELGDVSRWRLVDIGILEPDVFNQSLSGHTERPAQIINAIAAEQWLRTRFC